MYVSYIHLFGVDPLAYLAAKTHGLEEEAAAILEAAGMTQEPSVLSHAQLLKAPTPIVKKFDLNWPLLPITKNIFESGPGAAVATPVSPEMDLMHVPAPTAVTEADAWEDDMQDFADLNPVKKAPSSISPGGFAKPDIDLDDGEGWGMDDDLDIPLELESNGKAASVSSPTAVFSMPGPGLSASDHWIRNSGIAIDHCAAGSLESAMQVS